MKSQTTKGRRARDTIVAAAEALFADRGFYGTSMRDIAAAAGLPLATVVYHFARKEQLYGAILADIADELMRDVVDTAQRFALLRGPAEPDLAARKAHFLGALVAWTFARPARVRLITRELLDNPARVVRASQLPLAPFVAAAARHAGDEVAAMRLVGGISYLAIARPTIERIVGANRARELYRRFEEDHGPRLPERARSPRARARRAPDHRYGRRADPPAG